MSEFKNIASFRLIKTFGRLKGRSLSKNQKLGLAMLKEKYDVKEAARLCNEVMKKLDGEKFFLK